VTLLQSSVYVNKKDINACVYEIMTVEGGLLHPIRHHEMLVSNYDDLSIFGHDIPCNTESLCLL